VPTHDVGQQTSPLTFMFTTPLNSSQRETESLAAGSERVGKHWLGFGNTFASRWKQQSSSRNGETIQGIMEAIHSKASSSRSCQGQAIPSRDSRNCCRSGAQDILSICKHVDRTSQCQVWGTDLSRRSTQTRNSSWSILLDATKNGGVSNRSRLYQIKLVDDAIAGLVVTFIKRAPSTAFEGKAGCKSPKHTCWGRRGRESRSRGRSAVCSICLARQ